MKNISILGSTGSIGTQTLDIVRANDDLNVVAIAAGSNIKALEEQVREFNPELVCVYNEEAAKNLKTAINDTNTKVVTGMDGLIDNKKCRNSSNGICWHDWNKTNIRGN